MKLFKRILPALLLVATTAFAAYAITKDQVNQKIAELLLPINDQNTNAQLVFTDLKIDDVRTLDFGMDASLIKIGKENTLDFKLKNISYHYNNGINPLVTAEVMFKYDLLKGFGQGAINEMASNFEEMTTGFVDEFTKTYGEAAKLDVAMDELTKDQNGNVVSAKAHLNVVIDFNKLPAEVSPEDIEFKSIQIVLSADHSQVGGRVQSVLNPLHGSFSEDQVGLKEYIEKLLNEDKETYEFIGIAVAFIDKIATQLVEHKYEEENP